MCTHSVVGYNIHMIQGMEISLCRAFCAMRLLYYNLSTAKISKYKTYWAKGQHLIHQNVVEGKISLVAVVQKSWFSLRNKIFLIFEK